MKATRKQAQELARKAKAARTAGHTVELVASGPMIERGFEDPMTVTVEVDSIGPKWLTGYCYELQATRRFQVDAESLDFNLKI